MKFKLLLLAALLANGLFAQKNDTPLPDDFEVPKDLPAANAPGATEKTYEMFDIEKPPSFPGGESGLMNFLSENIKYPKAARKRGVQGSVVATFVVNKDGGISNITIRRDIGRGCGKEVERVLGLMPRWEPGVANGHPVKVRYTLPVKFALN